MPTTTTHPPPPTLRSRRSRSPDVAPPPVRNPGVRAQRAMPPALRAWQERALARLESSSGRDFLAVATPGAGKTAFALTAARRALDSGTAKRLIVVVPTQHLRTQWAEAGDGFGLHLDPSWSGRAGRLPADLQGIVTTYQQIATSAKALRTLAREAFVVLDEIHHAGESRAWGDGCLLAFDGASRRIALSGTPFRSDASPIPFVRYVGDEAEPDFEYDYGAALAEGQVVRPVYFPRIAGRMEWTAADGSHESATFDDALDASRSSQRLRTALSLEGEWLPAVLARAHDRLETLRRVDSRAGGMVVAMDQSHARGIARMLRERLGVVAAVATSDDPTASQRITRFAAGSAPWLVAVRMVSEGVDIPRLVVGVYATNTSTDLFFRQAVGRFVRVTTGSTLDRAFVFIPDDPRLRRFAAEVQEKRRHALRREREDDVFGDAGRESIATHARERDEPQLSLFAPISAVVLDADGRPIVEPTGARSIAAGDGAPDIATIASVGPAAPLVPAAQSVSATSKVVTSQPAPPSATEPVADAQDGASPRERRRVLRERNAALARLIARARNLSFVEVNSELNRRIGIRRVDEATEAQLGKRIEIAQKWFERRG